MVGGTSEVVGGTSEVGRGTCEVGLTHHISAPSRDLAVQIELSKLAAGVYFVAVITEDGVSNMTKLII